MEGTGDEKVALAKGLYIFFMTETQPRTCLQPWCSNKAITRKKKKIKAMLLFCLQKQNKAWIGRWVCCVQTTTL